MSLDGLEIGVDNRMLSKGERKELRHLRLLEGDSSLRENIKLAMERFKKASRPLPMLHVTSEEVLLPDGRRIKTGFVNNIVTNGFRPKESNVSVFIDRKKSGVVVASPELYLHDPQTFLKEIDLKIRRYKHHGVRVNRSYGSEIPDGSVGIPVMLVVDAQNARLRHGTDRDDHFILQNMVSGSDVIGKINLENVNPNIDSDLKRVVSEFVEILLRSQL